MTALVAAHTTNRDLEGFETVSAKDENYILRIDKGRGLVWIELAGFRCEIKATSALKAFCEFYSAQPFRKIIFDYRNANYPDDLYAIIERYSEIAEALPRSEIAAVKGKRDDTFAILAGQAIQAAGHTVAVVETLSEALAALSD